MNYIDDDPFGLSENEVLDQETGKVTTKDDFIDQIVEIEKNKRKKPVDPKKCKHPEPESYDIPTVDNKRFKGMVCWDCNKVLSHERYKP